MRALSVALVFVLVTASWAGTPVLVPHDTSTYTVSLPKGWTVVDNPSQGMVIAKQDPKRKDAAQVIVIATTHSQATGEQVLDAIVKNGLVDGKIARREAVGDDGTLIVADGKAEGIPARLGAIAGGTGGIAFLVVLIAKTSEFEALGGIATVTSVFATLKPPTATQPPAKSGEVMEPTYDSYNNLIVPPPRRAITAADLAGEWKNTGKSIKSYVDTSTGRYGGYSAVISEKSWTIDAKGGLHERFNSVHASNNGGGTFQTSGENTGTLTIATDRVLTYTVKGRTTLYLLRGWFVGPELTVMRVNGPYWNLKDIDADTRADKVGGNLDEYWVRKTR